VADIGDALTDRELLISLNERVLALTNRLDANITMMNKRFDHGQGKFCEIDDKLSDHDVRLSSLEIFRQGVTWVAMAVSVLIVGLLWAIFTGQAGVVFR